MAIDERARFELEYWRLVLEDAEAVSKAITVAAEHVVEIPVTLLAALTLPESQRGTPLTDAARSSRSAMQALLEATAPVDRLLATVGGRLKAIEQATQE